MPPPHPVMRIAIDLPDELLGALRLEDAASVAAELRLAAAAKYYEIGRLSQEQAARLAGLPRARFLEELHRFGVSPFQATAEEILSESEDL